MDKKILIALAIAILLVSGGIAYVFILNSGQDIDDKLPNQTTEDKITVYYIIDDTKEEKKVEGSTLREVFDNAVENIVFNSAGQVSSVDGVRAGSGQKWVMWIWSDAKWSTISSVTNDVKGDEDDRIELRSGMHLALMLSDMTITDGKASYADPGFPIIQKVWFFIKFSEDYSANDYVNSTFTLEERKAGFWVRGEGIDAAEALQDVADRYGWNISMSLDPSQKGWLYHFFGLEDVQTVDGNWQYWSQYRWDGENWQYNQRTLGGFDISDVHYFALVRQTTVVNGTDFEWDVTPEDIPESLLA